MNKLLFSVFVLLFVLHIGFPLFSQKNISTQLHGWGIYTGNHSIYKQFSLHTEYQYRRSDFVKEWQQSLLRVGVDYNAKDGTVYTLGYGWIKSFPYGEQPIAYAFNEHRIWQTVTTKSKVARLDLQHRYRLEQRFLEHYVQNETGEYRLQEYLFRQRIRYRFMVTIPLNHKAMEDKTYFLSFYDEVFLGFGKGIGKNIMDQNRLSCTLGYKLDKRLTLQAGYLNQFVVKSNAIDMERNHTVQLALTYNHDFRRTK
jgi:hypothetical protein